MSLSGRVVRGAGWMAGGTGMKQALNVCTTLVLARLLGPDIIGVIALLMVFIVAGELIIDLGLGTAIIQGKEPEDLRLATAFTATLAAAAAVVTAIVLVAGWIESAVGQEGFAALLRVSSAGLLTTPYSGIQAALLTRRLRFREVALVEVSRVVLYATCALALALQGCGVWSVVAGTLLGQAGAVPVWRRLGGWKYRVRFDPGCFAELFDVGRNILLFRIVRYASASCDRLIVGGMLGMGPLGYYSVAIGATLRPLRMLAHPLGRVAFPAFTTIRGEVKRVQSAYLRMVSYLGLAAFPVLGGLAATAPEGVELVLGPEWRPAVPILRLMCIAGMAQAIVGTVGSVFLSHGRSDLELRFALLNGATIISAITAGAQYGLVGIAYAYLTATVLAFMWTLASALRLMRLSIVDVLKTLMPPACAVAAMIVAVIGYRATVIAYARPGDLFVLGTAAALGALVYFSSLKLFGTAVLKEVKSLLASALS